MKNNSKYESTKKENDVEHLFKLSQVDYVTRNFLIKTSKLIPFYELSFKKARNQFLNVQNEYPTEEIPVNIQDLTIPYCKSKILIRIIRPPNNKNKLPVIIYFYGGGWILGSKITHDRLGRELSVRTNSALIFVNYTPAPEAKFPVQINELYYATKYISKHGNKFNLNTDKMIIAGDSAGANMATVVAQLITKKCSHILLAQILLYPVTNANLTSESYKLFENGPWLTKKSMEWFWKAYLPKCQSKDDPLVSPLLAPIKKLKGLPQTFILTDENDVLRDEGNAYGKKLIEAGVKVTAVTYLSTIHDFVMLNGLVDSVESEAALDQITRYINNVFYC